VIRPFAGFLDPARGPDPVLDGAVFEELDDIAWHLDGAIYNLGALAEELELSDPTPLAAVIARGYRRWGRDLAPRLRGEFTLLVWDRRAGRGLLIPDQIGVRRPVFRREGSRLWFASEIAPLLELLPTRPAPNPAAVANWLTARPAPEGETLYRGIESMGPGQLLELGAGAAVTWRYWRPRYEEPLQLGDDALTSRIRATLEAAVSRRATPGAPLGVLMSGGLDSTSVAGLAKLAGADEVLACSVVFPAHPEIDESAWIDVMKSEAGISGPRLAAAGRGLLAGGLEYLNRWQLPSHAWNEAWTQPLLREAAARGATAMLDGEGGDELFGSRLLLIADLIRGGHPLAAARFARGLPEAGGRASRRVLAKVLWEYGLKGVPTKAMARAWQALPGVGAAAPGWASEEMARLLRSGEGPSWRSDEGPRWWALLTHALTEGVHGFGLLDHMRRRSEQAGLESRHPLFDLELLELMLRVPPARCSAGRLTRPLLRRAMAGISPDEVRLRPGKSVFDGLIVSAVAGPEITAIREILDDGKGELGAYVRPDRLREMLRPRAPLSGAAARDLLRMTAVEAWLSSQGNPELPRQLLARPALTHSDNRLEGAAAQV
jgi:asparagine synthase (glutamine-hydrolysing)